MKNSFGSAKDKRNKLIWAVLFLVIAGLSVYAVTSAARGFSFERYLKLLEHANPVYLLLAVLSMFGYVFFEGMAIRTLVKSFGHKCSIRQATVYSAADIYFSSITPSATAGQPASAYFMINSGIPSSCTTISLIFNLALYTVSIIVIGILTLIFAPSAFLFFGTTGRVLIIIGAATLAGLTLLFVLLALKRNFVARAGSIIIGIGCRLRIIKDRLAWNKKLDKFVSEYMVYSAQIKDHSKAIIIALIYNVLQRACQLAVTMFCYIAININRNWMTTAQVIKSGIKLMGAQSFISIGSTYIPIPGAMGFTDFMMLDGFSKIMPEAEAAGLELLSRSISFYSCVIICFVIIAVAFLRHKDNEA